MECGGEGGIAGNVENPIPFENGFSKSLSKIISNPWCKFSLSIPSRCLAHLNRSPEDFAAWNKIPASLEFLKP